jgi:EAL domain-containing protein (putative c-di-GMP-specific phosphodiesterase class I)
MKLKSLKIKIKVSAAERHLLLALWPVILCAVSAFLIAAIWLPIAGAKAQWISFYFGLAFVIILLLGVIVMGLAFLHKHANAADLSLAEMKEQLESFEKGNIALSNTHHDSVALDQLQESLNQTIATYSSYHLAYAPTAEEEALWKSLAEGEVLPEEEFNRRLPSFIQSNHNYRSALLLVESLGNNAKDEVALRDLKTFLLACFPQSFLGDHGDDGYAVYIPCVDSFVALQSQCEDVVTHYRSFGAQGRGSSQIAYCKIGGVVYPYVPLPLFLKSAEEELLKSNDVSLKGAGEEVSYPPYLLSEDNKKSIDEALLGNYRTSFEKADTFDEALRVLKEFALWNAGETGFEGCGLLSFHPESEEYKVLFEVQKENGDKSFARLGSPFASALADPFYEQAIAEHGFFARESESLPSATRSALANLGIDSFDFRAIAFGGEKRGLLYFVSSRPHQPLSPREQLCLNAFYSVASNFLVSFQEKTVTLERVALLESVCERGGKYLYSIDKKTHKIAYMSHNLAKAFPQAEIGDLCYKALRGANEVCPSCPLLHGSEKRVIDGLGASEVSLSALRVGSLQGLASILIEAVGKNASSSDNRFLDPSLQIKNQEALLLDLARSLKGHEDGYFLSLKLLNLDECLKKGQGLDQDGVMSLLSKNIQDAGYGDVVYRIDEVTLGFLLKEYPSNKINTFVEEISEIIRGPLTYEMAKIDPLYAYSALAYPGDAQTAREILALSESELLRSAGYGNGYLVRVANAHPRKALREEYVDDLLEKSLAREVMPIAIQPVVEAITGKVVSADILARLYGDEGDPIPLSEFFHAAERKNLVNKIDLGSLWSAGKLAEDYAEAYFSKSSLTSLCVYLSRSAIVDPAYPDAVKRFYQKYKLPQQFLHFIVENGEIKDHRVELEGLIASLASFGIVWEVSGLDPETCDFDLLKKLGITHLRSERTLIGRAVSSSSDYALMSRFVTSAVRAGFSVMSTGVESKEEKEVAEHLGISYLSGYYFSKALSEKDFIQFLAYGK